LRPHLFQNFATEKDHGQPLRPSRVVCSCVKLQELHIYAPIRVALAPAPCRFWDLPSGGLCFRFAAASAFCKSPTQQGVGKDTIVTDSAYTDSGSLSSYLQKKYPAMSSNEAARSDTHNGPSRSSALLTRSIRCRKSAEDPLLLGKGKPCISRILVTRLGADKRTSKSGVILPLPCVRDGAVTSIRP